MTKEKCIRKCQQTNKPTYNNIHHAIAMCHFHKFKFHFILNSLPLYFSAKRYFFVAIKSLKNISTFWYKFHLWQLSVKRVLYVIGLHIQLNETCCLLLYLCRRQRKYAWIHFKMTWCQRIWIILFENKDKELQFLFFTGCGNGTNFVQISYTKKKQIHMLIVAFMLFKNGFLCYILS